MKFIVFLIGVVVCDLPVHCLKQQIQGKWKLSLTEPVSKEGAVPCGHSIPDDAKNSYKAGTDLSFKESLELTLNEDYSVVDSKNLQGQWTMIYDEGFEIRYKNVIYFAFSRYQASQKGYNSLCGETLVGWYNNEVTSERGCYRAHKLDEQKATESLEQISILQPEFIQKTTTPQFTKESTNHKDIVDHINSKNNKWRATVHKQFEGKSLLELNQIAGRKKYHQMKTKSFAQIRKSDVSDLPNEFSYAELLSRPRQQEQCGSCYAIAAMSMLSARLKKQGENVNLSPQYSVDCNYYNQGCDGGYSILVQKFASESYLVTEEQYPYKGVTGDCKQPDFSHSNKVFSAQNYRYVGGGYGMTNEREIMLELYHNGPLVLSFEPSYDFMYYKEGIYHSAAESDSHSDWEKVDHSVLCYGWGEEKGEKFWMIQNSWGSDWGENGNFRIRRGVDESDIESMGEAADPVILTKSNNGQFIEFKTRNNILVQQSRR